MHGGMEAQLHSSYLLGQDLLYAPVIFGTAEDTELRTDKCQSQAA
jgi:hypothetical protein